MKVLFPIGSIYPAQSGGPSNTIYWIGKALQQKLVKVKIVTTNKDIDTGKLELNKWLSLEYGEVRYCKTKLHYLPVSLIWHSWKSVRSIDVVHLTALYYPPSLLIALRAVILGKPIVWSVRGELHASALQFSSFKKKVFLFFISMVPKKNISFHATSPEETELVRKHFGEKTKVIQLPNYIELPNVVEPTDHNLYFLFIGRLHPIKGLDNLVEGLAASERFKNSDYQFKLAGEGNADYMNELKTKIEKLGLSEKMSFVGSKTGLEKQKLYANARYTFLLSHSENFGNVVVESLAQSTPVVASKGTPWKMLEKSKSGYWINNDPVSIASTIDHIITMEEYDYLPMRMNAIQLARAEFDIELNIQKWMNVYEEVMND